MKDVVRACCCTENHDATQFGDDAVIIYAAINTGEIAVFGSFPVVSHFGKRGLATQAEI